MQAAEAKANQGDAGGKGPAARTAQLGHGLKALWGLDPNIRHINHGSFGATPIEILEEQARWRSRMERNPARFFMNELPSELRRAASLAAPSFGTSPERFAFVENATAGANAVLRSLEFRQGDEILVTDHVYNAVRNTIRHVAAGCGATLIEAPAPYPLADEDQAFNCVIRAISPRTRLVVIDHIASASAATFPVARIAQACRERGIPLLVDGAHGPGQLDLNIDAIDADWYVGNCHKWLCAPKGAAFIVAADRAVPAIHPLAISHAYGQGFVAEFDKTGTRDATPWLCIPAAIAFHERLGGQKLRARNRALAIEVADQITRETGMAAACDATLRHAMAALRLPLNRPATREDTGFVHDWLYDRHRFEAAVTILQGGLHLRISVQAYNESGDYEGLGAAAMDAARALP